jgi:hypothetical protein
MNVKGIKVGLHDCRKLLKATTFFVFYQTVVARSRVNLHCTIRVIKALHAFENTNEGLLTIKARI